jgi:DNA-binding protein HU-beta
LHNYIGIAQNTASYILIPEGNSFASEYYSINRQINIMINKQSIVEAVHEKLGGTKVSAEQAVETMLETVVSGLKKGEEVSIAGLGIFSVKLRAARTAQVKAMRVPKFRAAKALKDAVKNS